MIPSRLLALTLALSIGEAPSPKVAEIRFEDLVRFSDVIAVGTVRCVETFVQDDWKPPGPDVFDELPPKVPIAEVTVTRVLKGHPDLARFLFLAAGTWTCDITSGEPGERALFFLHGAERDELFDDYLRQEIGTRFPGIPLMRVMWSGRGKMPLRTLPDGEYATYWAGDVILPRGFPSVEGPEPKYQFIRSAPLDAFEREIATCLAAQRKPWVRASVTDVLDGSSTWDLDLTLDRQARLVVHEAAGDREVRFVLDYARTVSLHETLARTRIEDPPEVHGSGHPRGGVRNLEILDAAEPMSIRLLALDESWMRGGSGGTTRLALEAWQTLRASFDEPSCSDHRSEDGRWLPR